MKQIKIIYVQPLAHITKNNSYFSSRYVLIYSDGTAEYSRIGLIKDSICYWLQYLIDELKARGVIDNITVDEFNKRYKIMVARIINVKSLNDLQ